ncbi:hypothetical protein [Paraburkholderia elongata]|uniref:Uncharacterized protein n=1 Tax=Paraburkholderia elongata TaxID=2675747 RepID=A0A972NMV7_9BURK|nr:hypothetical protein [Paraburkholderia elongata]NPT56331.1 hypothetical protein [Paraburkholderia elongata]NPT56349.1 hypothetical protein [Paraburkholderia elongata]NPT56362.1 hypothetical protein [Paraburkholderia elongata]
MPTVRKPTDEALALERVVNAARAVQAALAALQPHFASDGDGQPSTLELVAFEVAMQELKDAREAFDILMSRTSGENPTARHL